MWPGLCQTVSKFSACFALKIGSVTIKLCDLGYVKLFPNFLCFLQWKLDEFSVGLFWTFGAVTGHVVVCVAMFCLFLFFVVAFLMMKINWQQQHKYKKKKKNKNIFHRKWPFWSGFWINVLIYLSSDTFQKYFFYYLCVSIFACLCSVSVCVCLLMLHS